MEYLNQKKWSVIDLFSGGGGMSYGFFAHPEFQLRGAVDIEVGKPSQGKGKLQCNQTYERNCGIKPLAIDLKEISPADLKERIKESYGIDKPTVLISCAPCTGFSRANPQNHINDDKRNSLAVKSALFAKELKPDIFLMENARELIQGKFNHHYKKMKEILEAEGYTVHGNTHLLNKFGLPQKRERALVIAVSKQFPLHTIEELWEGYKVKKEATHVRSAISYLPPVKAGEKYRKDPMHVSPSFASNKSIRRLELIPKDGGSWVELKDHPEAEEILTPAMLRYISQGKFGSHPDVYGRMWWDRPAATIKRECSHIGNGRYAHPEQDRLCTVRELAVLQGFPKKYEFVSSGLANMYRHIGDAVPPLISFQLAKVCEWILSGNKPSIESVILEDTHLTESDIIREEQMLLKLWA